MMAVEEGGREECAVCTCELTPPYILCKRCPPSLKICLPCFAKGAQVGAHQNDHEYSVVRDDFPLFEKHWTAAEEVLLMNAIEASGYGNWSDISRQVPGKSEAECERHYNRCYITKPQCPQLPKFPEHEPDFVPTPIVFKLSDNPPRPPEGSPMCSEMAGYCAPRGEFTVEFNNFAELEMCKISFTDNKHEEEEDEEDIQLMNEMRMAMLYSYHQALRERHRRKRILKEYGLISLRSIMWNQQCRLDRDLQQTLARLQVFTPLMSPTRNNMLEEMLHYEQELKNHISRLQELRRSGVKHKHSMALYFLLSNRRKMSRQRRRCLTDVMTHVRDDQVCQSWLQKQGAEGDPGKIIPLPSVPRKPAAPLQIEGMVFFDRLTPAERELCRKERFTPKAYLEYSAVLMREAAKHGGLRLGQARSLFRIDVNKTRKLYNFLVHEGKIQNR